MGMSEEERAAKYPFLTTVTEAEEEVARRRQQRAQMGLGEDIEFMNKVYVWGLNDRGQLGSDLGEYIVSSVYVVNEHYSSVYSVMCVKCMWC